MIHGRIGIATLVLGHLVFGGLPSHQPLSAHAQKPASTPPYFVYPVTTDLQRQLLPVPADLCVIMDTTEAFKGDEISMEGLNLNDLRKDLLKHKKADTRLHFILFFQKTEKSRSQTGNLLRYAVIGWAHEMGFSKVTAFGSWHNDPITWPELVDSFASKKARQPKGNEAFKGNDIVKVFPVRTELSRFLTGDADCAVVVVPALEKEKGAIPGPIRKATSKYLAELKLTHKKKVTFFIRHVRSDEIRDTLMEELNQFAEKLGFENNSVWFR